MKVAWPQAVTRERREGEVVKERASLLQELPTPEIADKVIKKGLVEGYNLLECGR